MPLVHPNGNQISERIQEVAKKYGFFKPGQKRKVPSLVCGVCANPDLMVYDVSSSSPNTLMLISSCCMNTVSCAYNTPEGSIPILSIMMDTVLIDIEKISHVVEKDEGGKRFYALTEELSKESQILHPW